MAEQATKREKVVIIGSGPAGWSSAIYASRAQLAPLVYEGAISESNRLSGTLPLGQLALTTEVENYAGFPHGDLSTFLDSSIAPERRQIMAPHAKAGVSGPELMELMRQQAANFGTRIVTDDIAKVDFSRRPFRLWPAEGGLVEAECVIVATGARANWLAMEVPYFEYHLKGIGKPLPKVTLAKGDDAKLARFTVDAPHPIVKAELYWAAPFGAETLKDPGLLAKAVVDRKWSAIPAARHGDTYEAPIPAEAAQWFILVSDDRPVSVSSDMMTMKGR